MIRSTRRQFLKTSGAFVVVAALGDGFAFKKTELRLSFSTLGCPDWSFEKITDFAAANGYSGIEIRGLQRQMDLTR